MLKVWQVRNGFPAGIHAREWISPAVCTYVLREIVENAASNGYVDQINFHMLPVANPDGYEYTFSDVSNFSQCSS